MERTTTSPEFRPTRIWMETPSSRRTPSAYCLHGLLHPERRVAGAHGVVLMGQRRAEEGHDAVAHHLVDRALVAVDGVHHALEHRVEELARLLGVAVGEQLHRALEVGEEDRDLLALAFEGGLGGEDLLGEVLGGVGLRGGEGWGALRVGAASPAMRAPHLPQKANPSGWRSRTRHRDASLVPQRPQNAIAGGFSKAHCGQVIAPSSSISASACSSQKRMSISRYIVVAVVRCSLRLLALAGAPVELAEAEVAVGDERAHAARLGERQRLAVVGLAALGVEPVGMGRDVAEQVQRMGREPGLTRRGSTARSPRLPRLVEPAEQQTGATQRVVGPAATADDSPRRLTLEELLAFPEPVQRLARLAELRQHPGGGGDRRGKQEDDVPRPDHRDPVLDQWARLRPVALEEMDVPAA